MGIPSLLRSENGQTTIFASLSLVVLIAFVGLAVDGGSLWYSQSHLRIAAESAALAGALEVKPCLGIANCSAMQSAASSALEMLRRAAAAVLRVRGAPGADPRDLAFAIWSLSHGVAMLAIAGHLDPAFEGADPAVILRTASAGLIEAAVAKAR